MFGSITPCIPTLVQNIPALSVAFSSPHFNRIKQDFIFLNTPLFHRNKSVVCCFLKKNKTKNSITNISHHIKVSFSPFFNRIFSEFASKFSKPGAFKLRENIDKTKCCFSTSASFSFTVQRCETYKGAVSNQATPKKIIIHK